MMKTPIERLKEAMKPIAQLTIKSDVNFSISTREPHLIEQMVSEMNERAASDKVYLKKQEHSQIQSADLHIFQYRLIPRENNLKRVEYEDALKYFVHSLPHIAENFLLKNHQKA